MDASFWHERWADNKIGFHEVEPNPLLVEHIHQLNLQPGARIFIPLCGKTLDIGWLLSQGYQVVGAELSELAISQLFDELGVTPEVLELDNHKYSHHKHSHHKHYHADGLDIFVGDIFQLAAEQVGPIDAIYDRAALVALPENMRANYTRQLRDLTRNAPQLLISYEYDQNLMAGPPFSLADAEINGHYSNTYKLKKLVSTEVTNLKLQEAKVEEKVWMLEPRGGPY